jgi:predicted DNA-binding transcriptional regulator YafY
MSTNKNAAIRYQTLDRCFRNPGRRYSIDDLVNECNEALSDVDSGSSGVQKRQVYDDIKFMKDPRGFDAPIEAFKDGRIAYYRYTEQDFSINSQPLNEMEAQQLKESLLTLSRFKGMPQFDWIEEITARLEHSFNLKSDQKVISFDDNPYLTGREYIGKLYNAIVNHQVLTIQYLPFRKEKEITFEIHPYHLKQYNNRWFLFGISNGEKNITNLPLDRIVTIADSNTKYIANIEYDFEEFFEDVIGVTIPNNEKPEKVLLKIDKELWPYIKTKPLHGSQKIKQETDEFTIVQLDVHLNYELESLILSRGESIEVIEPELLRDRLRDRIRILNSKYQ